MILNTKRIHNFFWRNSPARAKQTPSKVLFVAKKKRSSQLFTSVSVASSGNLPRRFAASVNIPQLSTSTSVNNCYLL